METKVTNYNSKLDKLMQDLRDWALLNIQVGVQQIREGVQQIGEGIQQIWEGLSLDSLACVGQVGLIKGKKCLDGT